MTSSVEFEGTYILLYGQSAVVVTVNWDFFKVAITAVTDILKTVVKIAVTATPFK